MKKLVFITGTRADWGKQKSLIDIAIKSKLFAVFIFVTGMHMDKDKGGSVNEISKQYPKHYFPFHNQHSNYTMDEALSKTIDGFSLYVKDINPDAIIFHGDRLEALAAASVGALNNILTIHIEGGERSGTIDDSLRHCISKLAHVHFVSHDKAKNRLLQMGEPKENIYVIGSPDLDIMRSKNLPELKKVKRYYGLTAPKTLDSLYFNKYAILMFHPVTTEQDVIKHQIKNICDAVYKNLEKDHNTQFLIIQPNNDTGSHIIINEYKERYKNMLWAMNVRMFPNLKFESFLTLLKHAKFIIGNSSAGIREAGYYNVPCINIGTRQHGRSASSHIINCNPLADHIESAIDNIQSYKWDKSKKESFGTGNSAKQFLKILKSPSLWKTKIQKQFVDLNDF